MNAQPVRFRRAALLAAHRKNLLCENSNARGSGARAAMSLRRKASGSRSRSDGEKASAEPPKIQTSNSHRSCHPHKTSRCAAAIRSNDKRKVLPQHRKTAAQRRQIIGGRRSPPSAADRETQEFVR